MLLSTLAVTMFAAGPTLVCRGARVQLDLPTWRKRLVASTPEQLEFELKQFGTSEERDRAATHR
jgi:hypothetical protein